MCKQKVFPGRNSRTSQLPDPPSSDVLSDQEDEDNDSLVPNESTPLLSGSNMSRLGNVFASPRNHSTPIPQDGCDASSEGQLRSSYQFASVNISPSTSSMEDDSLTVPVMIPGGDLLSSGEHSLNGDVMDFSPTENWLPETSQQQRITVLEGGDVVMPRRTPSASSMLVSSLPSTSASQSSSRQQGSSPRFLRNNRSKRKHSYSSDDHDVVV